MPFKNRIRLPFHVTRPQYPREANVFRRADGSTKVQSVIIKMVFEGETDNLPKAIHERLIIALSHDDVIVEGMYYLGGVSLDGDYDIDWVKFLNFPLAKAAFKVQVTPFNYSNDNCQTCEEASQVVCEDDLIGSIGEDETLEVPVLENDSICCSPVVISLVTYNTDYLDSCIVSGNEIIIHTKTELVTQNNVTIVTYRAQCPNGNYDEANIIADIAGSIEECLSPANLAIGTITDTSAQATWTAPSPAPVSYHWELYLLSDLINPVSTGDTTDLFVNLSGLSAGTQYRFFVRSVCDSDSSNYVNADFTTSQPPDQEDCGQYLLTNNSLGFTNVSYIDCNGNYQNVVIQTGQSSVICALQNSPGDPVEIIDQNGNVDISYLGLC